jgi:uncharacterized membrane protein
LPSTPSLTPSAGVTPATDDGLRVAVLIAYGLFGLAVINGLTAILGVVLAYVKRNEARGTVWEGHFSNLITVFWATIILCALIVAVVVPTTFGFALSLFASNGNPPPLQVGWLIAVVPAIILVMILFGIWYLYRVLRGFLHAIDTEPY